MADAAYLAGVRVVDADSHIVEPPDLWTARLPASMAEVAPRVAVHPETGHHHWRVGDVWLRPVGFYGRAGWPQYPPHTPNEYEDVDPGTWQPRERLRRMDEYGLWAQVLYPNLIGFDSTSFVALGHEAATACVRAYNDFLVEWCSEDPDRLVPIAMVPYWDVEASVREITRAAATGHRGIMFANAYERIGLPPFTHPHWDPVYAAAQDAGLAVNFHIGFSPAQEATSVDLLERIRTYEADRVVRDTVMVVLSNATAIAQLLSSDLCERFSRLAFVSVESGFGYVPYLLESLDWHWQGHGVFRQRPTPPSEYFRRQCYGSFWFERGTLALLEQYPDNFMFETDYPHPTSLSPGPASPAEVPSAHIEAAFARVPAEVARKALHDNAARVYHLEAASPQRG
jgi:predicted TIM-barrel fold metal-dependent hydrolase